MPSDFDLPTLAPSWAKTRHEIEIFAFTWNAGPVYLRDDVASLQVSKDLGGTGSFQVQLWPRVPTGIGRVASSAKRPTFISYLDVFRPNDWVGIFVNPHDDLRLGPEGLMLGTIDRVSRSMQIDRDGVRRTTVTLSGSGFAKCLAMTRVVSDQWMLDITGIGNLYSLAWHDLPQVITKIPDAVKMVLETYLTNTKAKRLLQKTQPADMLLDKLVNDPEGAADLLAMTAQTAETPKFSTDTEPIEGQYVVPVLNRPLWSILQLEFDALDDLLLTVPSEWFRHLDSSVLDTARAVANPALNELFFDVRDPGHKGLPGGRKQAEIRDGFEFDAFDTLATHAASLAVTGTDAEGRPLGYFSRLAPFGILRRRPLFQDEIAQLPGPTLRDVDLIADDVGYSDAELANLCYVTVPVAQSTDMALRATVFPKYADPASIRRHGLRILQTSVTSVPGRPEDDIGALTDEQRRTLYESRKEDQIAEKYVARLLHAYRQNASLLSGTVVLPRLLRNVWIGGKLMIARRNLEGQGNAALQMYYVESMSYSWTYPDVFYHSIGLSRGREVRDGYQDFEQAARTVLA